MLVLSRKENESILLGDDIEVIVLGIDHNRVKLGLRAPGTTKIMRTEIVERERESDAGTH